jgi:glycosyltransferase involved in cell wall biosynthesis
MKIAVFVPEMGGAPGFEKVISAHAQLPLKTINILNEANYEVILVTTKLKENRSKPFNWPNENSIRYVKDGKKRGENTVMYDGPIQGYNYLKLGIQFFEILLILKKEKIQILHSFGTQKVALFASFVKIFLPSIKIYHTINVGNISILSKPFLSNIDKLFTSTFFYKDFLKSKNISCDVIKHGGAKRELKKRDYKDRVVFWRDPSHENGADICLDAFVQVSNKYPDIEFTFAVRPHYNNVLDLNIIDSYDNISYFEFPYKNNKSIDDFLNESILIILPFRSLSTNPQYAVIESLQFDSILITSDVESNKEVIEGTNGILLKQNTSEELANLLMEQLDHYKLNHKLKDINLKTSFNWDNYKNKILDYYKLTNTKLRN